MKTTEAVSFVADAQSLQADLIALRRSIHQEPEIGLDLPLTQAKVLQALSGLDLEITLGKSLSSVVAVLRGGLPGPTVLLRGDMDGLPVQEQSDLDYRSLNGTMHACGHDLHTSWLVGAARLLAAGRETLHGKVVFMFQPGEESWAGAHHMIEEGLLEATGETPVAAYALHAMPGKLGVFGTIAGPILASSNQLRITLHGKGGHGSQPSNAVDPVPALAELTLALTAMPTRRIAAHELVAVTVSELSASKAINVINDSASLAATVRAHSTVVLDTIEREARRLAEGIAAAHGLTADFAFTRVYPSTYNEPAEAERVANTVTDLFGADRFQSLVHPVMGSEDFSFVLEKVPGAFVLLAASPPHIDPETAAYNHSPLVLFDDAVLGDGAALLAQLAWDRLKEEAHVR